MGRALLRSCGLVVDLQSLVSESSPSYLISQRHTHRAGVPHLARLLTAKRPDTGSWNFEMAGNWVTTIRVHIRTDAELSDVRLGDLEFGVR